MKTNFIQASGRGVLLLSAVVLMILVACSKKNSPTEPSDIDSGNIIGKIGCYDVQDTDCTIMQKGFVIVTNHNDTFLTFHLEGADTISVTYGTYTISPIAIPYNFNYKLLETTDERYVHIAPIIEDCMHLPITIPLETMNQAIITPCK